MLAPPFVSRLEGIDDGIDFYDSSAFPIVFKFDFPDIETCAMFRVLIFDAMALTQSTLDETVFWNFEYLRCTSHQPSALFVLCLNQRPEQLSGLAERLEYEVSIDRVLADWRVAGRALAALQLFLQQLTLMESWGTRFFWRYDDVSLFDVPNSSSIVDVDSANSADEAETFGADSDADTSESDLLSDEW